MALGRAFGMFERDAICCGTVSVAQCAALQELQRGPREIGRMAGIMGVAQSSMTRLVDGLEKRGWVERVRAGQDRRRVEVELSPAGRKEAARLSGLTEEIMATIRERIPEGKRDQVLESLTLLREAIEDVRCCGRVED
jgi:DNA-binding MarR family transcriptional regulator